MGCPSAIPLLPATAAFPCPLRSYTKRLGFELIRKWFQRHRLTAGRMCKRLGKKPIGQPRVPRKEWAVEIGPDCPTDSASLVTRFPVVPEPEHHSPEGRRPGVEERSPDMILETRDPMYLRALELTLEEHVTDHARRPGDGLMREEANARHGRAIAAAIAPT